MGLYRIYKSHQTSRDCWWLLLASVPPLRGRDGDLHELLEATAADIWLANVFASEGKDDYGQICAKVTGVWVQLDLTFSARLDRQAKPLRRNWLEVQGLGLGMLHKDARRDLETAILEISERVAAEFWSRQTSTV